MDKNIKIVRHLELVFEPHRKMFKQFKAKEEAAVITLFLQRKGKHYKNNKILFGSGQLFSNSPIFAFLEAH